MKVRKKVKIILVFVVSVVFVSTGINSKSLCPKRLHIKLSLSIVINSTVVYKTIQV
jgi:hypothetical protein